MFLLFNKITILWQIVYKHVVFLMYESVPLYLTWLTKSFATFYVNMWLSPLCAPMCIFGTSILDKSFATLYASNSFLSYMSLYFNRRIKSFATFYTSTWCIPSLCAFVTAQRILSSLWWLGPRYRFRDDTTLVIVSVTVRRSFIIPLTAATLIIVFLMAQRSLSSPWRCDVRFCLRDDATLVIDPVMVQPSLLRHWRRGARYRPRGGLTLVFVSMTARPSLPSQWNCWNVQKYIIFQIIIF